ncbi:MAG: hypothetical protein IJP44_00740 [Bacteroidales bacterium]|nr:hypothetical protein [Bacteroidales bacterium]
MSKELDLLNIDELIAKESSFQKIMADGIVTDDELREQSERVIALLDEAERRFNADDLLFIKRLFAETNVLSAIYHYHELQNLNRHADF